MRSLISSCAADTLISRAIRSCEEDSAAAATDWFVPHQCILVLERMIEKHAARLMLFGWRRWRDATAAVCACLALDDEMFTLRRELRRAHVLLARLQQEAPPAPRRPQVRDFFFHADLLRVPADLGHLRLAGLLVDGRRRHVQERPPPADSPRACMSVRASLGHGRGACARATLDQCSYGLAHLVDLPHQPQQPLAVSLWFPPSTRQDGGGASHRRDRAQRRGSRAAGLALPAHPGPYRNLT